jgi:hypothetical protein
MISDSIKFEEDSTRLRISWDNRNVRKDQATFWFLVLFWTIWAPVTCIATVMIFTSDAPVFLTFWCMLGWLGTIVIPRTLLQRRYCEWMEVTPDSISWGASGLFARKLRTVPLSRISELGFGHCIDSEGPETQVTLNIYEQPKTFRHKPRHLLAYWLAKEHKEAIWNRIREFVAKQSIPLKTTTYGTLPS